MKRVVIKKGDILSVPMSDGTLRYLQYIGDDMSQLNSRVIRIFEGKFTADTEMKPDDIVKLKIDFYAHIYAISDGVRDLGWKKIGKSIEVGEEKDALFRDPGDPDTKAKVSKLWYVWHMNQESREHVSPLVKEEHKSADVGSVLPPEWIIEKMETGAYDLFYPNFE